MYLLIQTAYAASGGEQYPKRFKEKFGYYADAVSPALPTLPEGWNERLVEVAFESGETAWFLDPNDAAISKYVRSEPHDKAWIRAGLQAAILSLPIIEYRLRETSMETDERQQVKEAIAQDKAWLHSLESGHTQTTQTQGGQKDSVQPSTSTRPAKRPRKRDFDLGF